MLGDAATAGVLAPYRKQTKGLRRAADGVDDYRASLKNGEGSLAKRGLRKMAQGEALMKQARDDLDAALAHGDEIARLYY